MAKPNMREFKERAEQKQLTERLKQAFLSFNNYLYVADKQLVHRLIYAMPKPSIEDMGSLPPLRCTVYNEYLSRYDNKRDCLMAMLRMCVILWWWYQDKQLKKEVIERLITLLNELSDRYGNLKPQKIDVGYTFLEFHVFLSEADGDNRKSDTHSNTNID